MDSYRHLIGVPIKFDSWIKSREEAQRQKIALSHTPERGRRRERTFWKLFVVPWLCVVSVFYLATRITFFLHVNHSRNKKGTSIVIVVEIKYDKKCFGMGRRTGVTSLWKVWVNISRLCWQSSRKFFKTNLNIDKHKTLNLKHQRHHMWTPLQSLDSPADREIYVPKNFACTKAIYYYF